MKILKRRQFGDPVLRQKARRISKDEILSDDIQDLIKDLKYTLENRKYGIGLAAPQIGKSLAISYIGLKPTPTRPNLKRQDMAIINPEIVKTYGKKEQMWEGCISFGDPFAKAERFKKIRVRYLDEKARTHEKEFDGILAHVLQHEIDHLNGTLFVDRVVDSKTYVTTSEYKKIIKKNKHKRDVLFFGKAESILGS
jgi:peptide deformylase